MNRLANDEYIKEARLYQKEAQEYSRKRLLMDGERVNGLLLTAICRLLEAIAKTLIEIMYNTER